VPTTATPGPVRLRVIKKYSSAATACNNSGYGQAEDYTLMVQASGTTYTVGGSASGVVGSGLVLKLNGANDLPVAGDGAFTFPTALPDGNTYAVAVGASPAGQACSVANGSGTIAGANVTNVAVTCATVPTYTVGGTVGGLVGTGLKLKLNGGNDLAVTADGAFTFTGGLAGGTAYAVTVGTQPTAPAQTCTVANGSGTIGSANVTDVAVTCTTDIVDLIFADGFDPAPPQGVTLVEGFDDIATLAGAGWITKNNSTGPGTSGWFQGNDTVFPSYDGAATAYIGANFNNVSGAGTISNWLVTPLLTFDAASSLSFYTRSTIGSNGVSVYPDRLEVRLCTGATCTDVGTTPTAVGQFTTLLRSINPNLGTVDDPTGANGYPLTAWAPFTLDAAAGLPTSGQGRVAFRYYVTNGGTGSNSNFIGIDAVTIRAGAIGRSAGRAAPGSITATGSTSGRR
jgi:hypothetical protein